MRFIFDIKYASRSPFTAPVTSGRISSKARESLICFASSSHSVDSSLHVSPAGVLYMYWRSIPTAKSRPAGASASRAFGDDARRRGRRPPTAWGRARGRADRAATGRGRPCGTSRRRRARPRSCTADRASAAESRPRPPATTRSSLTARRAWTTWTRRR